MKSENNQHDTSMHIDEYHLRFDMMANTVLDSRGHYEIFMELSEILAAYKFKMEQLEGTMHSEDIVKHYDTILQAINIKYNFKKRKK